eukprot:CAMPEP_0181308794 /NCGR_PEP_ID=MMETSP1101-20121128/11667_1 /TAXON_ID=46948 /ORGANISM="Rhodomonas abbreviata, Strain Caron Lab Isolate" /LENGTH=860 /DNA_ID=CAMNT_0023415229 /DNA_START=191 /DNA_END=2773 /DNA_ORIENTATION=+
MAAGAAPDPTVVLRERLALKVISAQKDLDLLPQCYVKLTHGPKKLKTSTASGSTATFDYMCSMEVQKDIPTFHIELRTAGSFGSGHVLGSLEVPMDKLDKFESCMDSIPEGMDFPPNEMRLQLQGKANELIPIHVTIQVCKVTPPKPPYNLKAFIGTWNVGNAPPSDTLESWIVREHIAHAGIVAIGCQECQYEKRGAHKDNEADWVASISKAIGDTHSLLRNDNCGQMRLGIWVRFDVIAGITSAESASEATGLGHVMNNKGGVATVVQLWDTWIAFVNSHLAAHQDKTKRRNEDYCEIAGGIYLGFPNCALLNQFHHCIWMGDLNYRLDLSSEPDIGPEEANKRTPGKPLYDKINALIANKQYSKLLEWDQLVMARKNGEAYIGFEEGTITHPPTFKVERKAGITYKDQRAPAYCDRVMWRSLPYMRGACEHLWAGAEVDSSDHKPVGALLDLGMRPPRPDWWPRQGKDPNTGMARKSVHGEGDVGHSLLSIRHHTHTHDVPELLSWTVDILELRGVGLHPADYNGKSDPYVAFLGDALIEWQFTQVEYMNLDPTWPPATLPSVTMVATSKESFRYEYMVLGCMDYDRIDADDAIGNGVLAIADFVDKLGQEQEFAVDLAHAGLIRGKLIGKLKITEGTPMHMEDFIKKRLAKRSFGPKQSFSCMSMFQKKPDPPAHGGGGHAHSAHGHAASRSKPAIASAASAPEPQGSPRSVSSGPTPPPSPRSKPINLNAPTGTAKPGPPAAAKPPGPPPNLNAPLAITSRAVPFPALQQHPFAQTPAPGPGMHPNFKMWAPGPGFPPNAGGMPVPPAFPSMPPPPMQMQPPMMPGLPHGIPPSALPRNAQILSSRVLSASSATP